jgi:hypothetical protein
LRRTLPRLLLGGLLIASLVSPAVGQTIELPRAVPLFNQAYTDGPDAWGDCPLGTGGCPDQVCTTGCLTTAFASVLAYYGLELSVASEDSCSGRARSGMDPGILNDWLRANAAYGHCARDPIGDCCLDWGRLPGGVELTFHVNRSDVGLNPIASVVIDHALRQGRPVIAGVHWGAFCHGDTGLTEDCHWVVLTGKTGDTYSIVDPYNADSSSPYGIRTTLDAGVHGVYIIDRFVIVDHDPTVGSPVIDDTETERETGSEARSELSAVVLLAALALVTALVLLVTATGNGASGAP